MTNQIFCFQIKHTPWMAQMMVQFFPWLRDMRAFLLLDHLEIFSCMLLISNHMNFLVQFGTNKHLEIFQRSQIALALRAPAIFVSLCKIYSYLFIPNCTRNHVITYTNITEHAVAQIENLPIVYHCFTPQYSNLAHVENKPAIFRQLVDIWFVHTGLRPRWINHISTHRVKIILTYFHALRRISFSLQRLTKSREG